MFSLRKKKLDLPTADEALPGRAQRLSAPARHFVNGNRLEAPFPAGMQLAMFGLGCFWGAERKFWTTPGVYGTQVGYLGGITPNPTYEEVCTGYTGHNEVVRVVFDPQRVSYTELLRIFWESHDPTQDMRQGGDIGTQYRSGIYVYDGAQRAAAESSAPAYGEKLKAAGYPAITPRSVTCPRLSLPKSTTSSIWRRTRVATAVWAGPAWAVPAGSPGETRRRAASGSRR